MSDNENTDRNSPHAEHASPWNCTAEPAPQTPEKAPQQQNHRQPNPGEDALESTINAIRKAHAKNQPIHTQIETEDGMFSYCLNFGMYSRMLFAIQSLNVAQDVFKGVVACPVDNAD